VHPHPRLHSLVSREGGLVSNSRDFITVVSGLPRSGTSMMMQMLAAGGISPMTDEVRAADSDNPRGYYELEKVKHLRQDHTWLKDAVGKAVKIVHLLLMELPADRDYRVILMQRDLEEVLRSQATMLERSVRSGAAMEPERLTQVYANQLTNVRRWLAERSCFKVLEVNYREVLAEPAAVLARVNHFLGGGLDLEAMQCAIDPALYRNRAG
jgi:LPS sulfotransferase NodH